MVRIKKKNWDSKKKLQEKWEKNGRGNREKTRGKGENREEKWSE